MPYPNTNRVPNLAPNWAIIKEKKHDVVHFSGRPELCSKSKSGRCVWSRSYFLEEVWEHVNIWGRYIFMHNCNVVQICFVLV